MRCRSILLGFIDFGERIDMRTTLRFFYILLKDAGEAESDVGLVITPHLAHDDYAGLFAGGISGVRYHFFSGN